MRSFFRPRVGLGIFQDWSSNKGNFRIRFLLILFRIVNPFKRSSLTKLLGAPFIGFYKFYSEWVIGVELHWKCEVGPGLSIFHGYGLVVHSDARIGRNVKLRNGVTIGMKRTSGTLEVPTIGDDVDIGANAVVIGDVVVGARAVIGAGAVVVKDVPSAARAVGNPARILT